MSEVTTKQVQIRRKETRSYLPTKVTANAMKVVGSVLKDRRPLGIADDTLEKDLLRKYADIRTEDRDFSEKRSTFWQEMRVKVPSEGKVLDISTKDGEPVKLEDYLIFKWLENHPMVGSNKQEMLADPNKEYYIYDPNEEVKNENAKAQERKEAYRALIKLEDDEKVVDQLIRLLTNKNPDKLTKQVKENELEQITRTQPKRFLRYAKDKNLAIRAEVEEMVEFGILRKSGNQYIYMDEVIGETMEDAIVYFKNDRNSGTLLDLRAKLEEVKEIS